VRLYYSPGACSLVSQIALAEAGASFEAVRVAIGDGAHRRPHYLAVNPRGLVPALEADGRLFTETIAILTLVGRWYPESGLVPLDDALALARFYERLAYFATSVHAAGFGRVFRAARQGPWPTPDPATTAYDRERLVANLVEIEAILGRGQWLLGDRYTAADARPLTFIRWARRKGFDLAPYPHWQAHARRIVERPAVRRVLASEGLDPNEF
jgi:glutathione S-transferase